MVSLVRTEAGGSTGTGLTVNLSTPLVPGNRVTLIFAFSESSGFVSPTPGSDWEVLLLGQYIRGFNLLIDENTPSSHFFSKSSGRLVWRADIWDGADLPTAGLVTGSYSEPSPPNSPLISRVGLDPTIYITGFAGTGENFFFLTDPPVNYLRENMDSVSNGPPDRAELFRAYREVSAASENPGPWRLDAGAVAGFGSFFTIAIATAETPVGPTQNLSLPFYSSGFSPFYSADSVGINRERL